MSAFLYRWTEKSTGKWYVGSRTAENCHPADGYVCSSKIVKPLICSNPTNWTREILCIGSAKYIRKLETKYLKSINAKHHPMSYNKSNACGPGRTKSILKEYKGYEDLHPSSLRKLTAEEIVNKLVNEHDPYRIFYLNKFICSIVIARRT